MTPLASAPVDSTLVASPREVRELVQETRQEVASGACERCHGARGEPFYWPGTRATLTLCLSCVSPLCEWCGQRDATVSLGADGAWHICAECRSLSRFSRYRREKPLRDGGWSPGRRAGRSS